MPPVVNPGGPMQRALTPQQQRAPITIRSATQPAKPATGGHYVNLGGNVWRQIHAVGPGKWAPGPPAKPVAPAPAKTTTTKTTTTNQWSNPLYQPAATLSGKPLSDAATALTNATYDPVISQYQQQIANRTQQGAAAQQQAAGYFNQLGQYAQSAVDKANSIGADLNTTLQGIGQGTQSALDQIGAQQAAVPALQALQNEGLGGGATQQLAQQLAGLKATAATNAQSAQTYGATVGSAASQRAAGMLGAYALGGQAALGKIGEATQQALTPMETNLTSEQAKKAAAFGTNLQALRQQQFNNLVAQSGLNIKQQQITSTASTATANRQAANTRAANSLAQQKMESDRTYQLDKDKFGAAQAKDRYQKAHGLGPYAPPKSSSSAGSTGTAAKPMTPAQQRSVENQIARIQARFQWLYSHFQGIGANSSDAQQQALRAMTTGQIWAPPNPQSNNPAQRAWHWTYIQPEGDAQLRNIAFNSTNGNGLSAGDVAYLNRIGFTNRGLYPVAVQSPRTTPAPAGAGRTLR